MLKIKPTKVEFDQEGFADLEAQFEKLQTKKRESDEALARMMDFFSVLQVSGAEIAEDIFNYREFEFHLQSYPTGADSKPRLLIRGVRGTHR